MKRFTIVVLVMFLLVIMGLAGCIAQETLRPGDYNSKLTFNGLERTYQQHIPEGYNPKEAKALVIVLHGGGMTGEEMKETTQFNSLADEKGFIVVYPDAVEKGWNDDRKTSMERRSLRENIDDVGFISALIDKVKAEVNIDSKRVFVTGMSNGGMFSQRVARELGDKVAGFASVVAPMPETRSLMTDPTRPVPAMFILGAEDPVIPWSGGDIMWGKTEIGRGMPITYMVNYWVKNNKASQESIKSKVTLLDANGSVSSEIHRGLRGGAPVEVIIVDNNGHQWPGGAKSLPEKLAGRVNPEFSATKAIWRFFESIK